MIKPLITNMINIGDCAEPRSQLTQLTATWRQRTIGESLKLLGDRLCLWGDHAGTTLRSVTGFRFRSP